jgi:Flp pilus assembly protein TadD
MTGRKAAGLKRERRPSCRRTNLRPSSLLFFSEGERLFLMRHQQTPAFQLGINKQKCPRYVFVLILFILLMILFPIPAETAWMGVAIEDSQSDERKKKGIKVIAVDADGPGAQAGLQVGDLIILVDGKTVESSPPLVKIVREASEGTSLQMTILRKSERVSIQIILAEAPQHFIFVEQGWEQAEKGNYDEAIRYFTKALNFNPNHAEAYYSRGTAHFHKGQYDQAISDFDKALEINPNDAKAYYNRGIACCKKGQYDQAIPDFTKALEINPRDAEAYYNRGITFCQKGQHDQAISDFKKAFEINPNNPRYLEAYVNQEIAYYEDKGQYDQAISDYTNALEINPNDAEAYYNRGIAYYYKKEYDKSWEDVNKAQTLGLKISEEILENLRNALEKQSE